MSYEFSLGGKTYRFEGSEASLVICHVTGGYALVPIVWGETIPPTILNVGEPSVMIVELGAGNTIEEIAKVLGAAVATLVK